MFYLLIFIIVPEGTKIIIIISLSSFLIINIFRILVQIPVEITKSIKGYDNKCKEVITHQSHLGINELTLFY